MQERRRVQRHRTYKAGSVEFNRAGAIDCIVRNLSSLGACLEFENPLGIPDDFTLAIKTDHLHMPCHAVWRHGRRVGVAFDISLLPDTSLAA